MEQITVMVENKPGALADVLEILGRNGVNIKSISAEGLGEGGIIRIITEDIASAKNALNKTWHKFFVSEILPIKLIDRPGELAKVARKLSSAKINIECVYILGKDKGTTEVALKVDRSDAAKKILKQYL
jgi:hypothetical protein